MFTGQNRIDVRQALDNEWRLDFQPSLPLLEAQFATGALLPVLESSGAKLFRAVEKHLRCEICVLAFGSLGRFEFVHGYSDLDPLIIVNSSKSRKPDPTEIRDAILQPLLQVNPWLLAEDTDDNRRISAGELKGIEDIDLKYPVYEFDQLVENSNEEDIEQRQWQILLEATPLYGSQILEKLLQKIIPKVSDNKGVDHIDFSELISRIPNFFASFEDPTFLYKNAFKYWKTRILREFYSFANLLNLLLGWYLFKQGVSITPGYLSGCTTLKIMRATKFAAQMEKELKGNQKLEQFHQEQVAEVIKKHNLDTESLLLYGSTYKIKPAQQLHSMLANVLSRSSVCWQMIYDEKVRSALRQLRKKQCNFDATFVATIKDPKIRLIADDLVAKRTTYLRYMAAAAEVIHRAFARGKTWTNSTVGPPMSKCLEPFFTVTTKPGRS
jgi:hypothetical protein